MSERNCEVVSTVEKIIYIIKVNDPTFVKEILSNLIDKNKQKINYVETLPNGINRFYLIEISGVSKHGFIKLIGGPDKAVRHSAISLAELLVENKVDVVDVFVQPEIPVL